MHQELRNRFEQIWTHDNNLSIIVEKVTNEKRDELNRSDPNELKRIVDSMLGFTKVFRLLIQYKKVQILNLNVQRIKFIKLFLLQIAAYFALWFHGSFICVRKVL